MNFILPGVLSGLGILVVLFQFDKKKILGYSLVFDIMSTVILGWAFLGTFSGLMSGIIGGLTVSIVLFVAKKLIGYKRLTIKGWKTFDPEW